MSSGTAVAVTLAATAGLAGSVQAAVMGELGQRVGILPAVAVSAIVVIALAIAALLPIDRWHLLGLLLLAAGAGLSLSRA